MLGEIVEIANKVIDKVGDLFPSQEAKDKAKARLIELQQKGELADLEMAFEIVKAEAESNDKFVKRARPTFMYLFYLIIVFAIPMGIVAAVKPDVALALSEGMTAWWSSIPSELWWTFGVGFTGYTAFRSVDKAQLMKAKKAGNGFERVMNAMKK